MLPFDRRPWAKALATVVIILSCVGSVALCWYFYTVSALHIPEVVGTILFLLTVIPPNLAIITRKPGDVEALDASLKRPLDRTRIAH